MGTNKSSETMSEVEYLRSMRTTSQTQVDDHARKRDADDVPAEVRWSAVAHA